MASSSVATLDKIVALCKRRGFVYQSAEIYSGLNGVYDFGPLGALLKQTIKRLWLDDMKRFPEEVLLIDGAILGAYDVWKASGHIDNFSDPLVDCLQCKKRYRADDIDLDKPCASCGNKQWTPVRQFQLMFETQLGAVAGSSNVAYLRPETAQTIFVNFKNVMTSNRVKIPFGIAQIGKAFRNEITPKQFLFRMREFEQMEIEFFCHPTTSNSFFEVWKERRMNFFRKLGLTPERIRLRPHANDELAHYSSACVDVEYEFPFGWKELEGIAHRSDFDLTQHTKFSGKELAVFEPESGTSYVPHVVECSVGVDRLLLTLLFDAYDEDNVDGEIRTVLRFAPHIAPVTAAIMPLTNKLTEPAERLYADIKSRGYAVQYDYSGSIGKRYRRQDEIGTPVCITYDFETVEQQTVTIRDRDTMVQTRIGIDQIPAYLDELIRIK